MAVFSNSLVSQSSSSRSRTAPTSSAVAGADEGRDRLLVDLDLLEADSLILLLDRRAGADLAIALADAHRHIDDFPAPVLATLEAAAEMLERLDEEALDVMGLKAQRFG